MTDRPEDSPEPNAADDAEVIERAVRSGEAGLRLDVWLAGRPEIGGRPRAKRLCQLGLVDVDGQLAKAGQRLDPGQSVRVRLGEETTEDSLGQSPSDWTQAMPVLWEDAHMIVIDKPAGLSAHLPDGAAPGSAPNVAELAAHRFGPLAPAAGVRREGIVHRLDRETSGVLVLARTDAALHALRAQWKAREVEKEYRALTYGVPRFQSDWIERPLRTHPRQGDKMVIAGPGEGKEAITYYEIVERFDGFADVRCRPKTGRTHQIRVHLTSIGHSLLADRVYVSRNAQQRQLPQGAPHPGRHALHARRLTLRHPQTLDRMVFEAPLPEELLKLRDWLRRERPAR